MRILLVGEYSRLHNSLKEGLQALGHEVVILGKGDGFKNYPVDHYINHSYHSFFKRKFRVLVNKLFKVDLGSKEIFRKVMELMPELKGFDVVQLINESSIKTTPEYEMKFLKALIPQNKKLFLLSCGVDTVSMDYMMSEKPKYSLMSPYLKDKSKERTYRFQLAYLNEDYRQLNALIMEHCRGVITSDLDYHLPYLGKKKYLGLIPNPINVDQLDYKAVELKDKIKIFHGVNKQAIHKKGNDIFFKALDIISKKYADKIEIKTVYSLPYDEYIKAYEDCHILLDQVYGYDQGYNALEAMAQGKVVFTGAEEEWLEEYQLEPNTVAINAEPDANQIAKNLEWLITNPEQIAHISRNARKFIEKVHHYKTIAGKYLEVWNNN